jgi:hypothetical protein
VSPASRPEQSPLLKGTLNSYANIRLCHAKNNVTFEQATIEDFGIPNQSLDTVLGVSILHLLRDQEAVMAPMGRSSTIARVYQMLKPAAHLPSEALELSTPVSSLLDVKLLGLF